MNEIEKQIFRAVGDAMKVMGIAKERSYGTEIREMRIGIRETEGYTFPEVWGKLPNGRFVKFPLGQGKEGGIFARDTDSWRMWDKDARQEWELTPEGWVKYVQQPPQQAAPPPQFSQPVAPPAASPAAAPEVPQDDLPF